MSEEINNEQEERQNENSEKTEKGKRKRVRRGSKPPILTLREAVRIIQAFYEEAGGESNYDLFSRLTNNSVSSSVFTTKIGLLKNLNLIEEPAERQLRLSETGTSIVAPREPQEKQVGLKKAFLTNDVYKNIYEKFSGKLLPQEEFLKNIFADIVPRDFAEDWMTAFKESADFAGLFYQRDDGKLQVLEGIGTNGDNETEVETEEGVENDIPSTSPPPPVVLTPPEIVKPEKNDFQFLIEILNPTEMSEEEQKAVWTLIQYLKKKETGVI